MSTTSRLSLPYPGASSPANVPSDIYSLANTIDGNVAGYVTTGTGTTPPVASTHTGFIWWCSDTTNTTNFGLNYSDGSAWHNIGTDFVISGTTPTAKAINQLWFNTNSYTISYWNGTAWTAFALNASYIGGYQVATTSPATNQALIWNGSSWGPAKVPTAGIATGALPSGVTLPATQLTTGAIPSGVTLPATQVSTGALSTGVTLPAAQLTTGAIPSGVTLPASQVSTGALPSGVTIPATQLSTGAIPSGVTLPATQVTTGALPSGVTLPATQVTTGALPTGVTLPATQVTTGALSSGVTIPISQVTGGVLAVFGASTSAIVGTYSNQQVLVQFGSATVNTDTNGRASVSFPSAFPNGVLHLNIMGLNVTGNLLYTTVAQNGTITLSGFTASFWQASNAGTQNARTSVTGATLTYMAIGF